MRYNPKQVFPHPVLRPGSDDYQEHSFKFTFEETLDNEGIKFRFQFAMSEPTLLDLIREEKAAYAVLIESVSTSFRHLESRFDSHFDFPVKQRMLEGKVEISPYVVARVDIAEFTSPNIHPEFPERTFDFQAGTVLAIGETKVIYVEDAVPLGSVFEIQKSKTISDSTCHLHMDDDYVIISVSESDYPKLMSLRKTTEGLKILLQALYLPVITSLLHELDRDAGTDEGVNHDLKWVRAFLDKLEKAKLPKPGDEHVENRFLDAQRLLKEPLAKFFHVTENWLFDNG